LGPKQGEWFDRLETEFDNVRSALQWCMENREAEIGLRLASALQEFWPKRGALIEGAQRLGQLLALEDSAVPATVRARALDTAASLAWFQSDYQDSHTLSEMSLCIWRELGDRRGLSGTLSHMGAVALDRGDATAARGFAEEGVAAARELGDPVVLSWSLFRLAQAVELQGEYPAAKSLYEESITTAEQVPDPHTIALCLGGIGNLARGQEDLETARSHYEAALAIVQQLGDRACQGILRSRLASVALRGGEIDVARSHWQESLDLRWEEGERRGIAECLEGLAAVAAAQGKLDRSARFYGRAEALRRAIGAPLPPSERAELDRRLAAARAERGESAFAAIWAAGRALTLDQIVAEALER
jgi:tetratricopeptide (TPR) repeat protein